MIKKAYYDLLKRSPDTGAFNYFRKLLSSEKLTENQMINEIKSSREYMVKNRL
jgi:hypothetical protein